LEVIGNLIRTRKRLISYNIEFEGATALFYRGTEHSDANMIVKNLTSSYEIISRNKVNCLVASWILVFVT